MPDFSATDIDAAKRRVEDMHRRARDIVDDHTTPPEREPVPAPAADIATDNSLLSIFSSGDDTALILALVLLLAREKADNMLILALLYILL